MRWSTVSLDALARQDFDGDIVVRNARTGSTHLLEGFTAEVLYTLMEAEGPLSVADLEARLRLRCMRVEDDEQWSTAIEQVLNEFHHLGLAEPERG